MPQACSWRLGELRRNSIRENKAKGLWDFGEGRYHATAVFADCHLARCMMYIDLNMVRAGVLSSAYRRIANSAGAL